MARIISEAENDSFRQLYVLLTFIGWLLLSNFYCDRSWPIKFQIIRMLYFLITGLSRASVYYLEDATDLDRNTDDLITPRRIKLLTTAAKDFATWCVVLFAFGMSIFNWFEIVSAAWCFTFMCISERIF